MELKDLEKAIEKINEGFEATVENVKTMTNTEYFGDKGMYDERVGTAIYCKVETGDEFSVWYNMPKMVGLKKSNIHAFIEKYKGIPKKGMKVKAIINDDGFFEIEI